MSVVRSDKAVDGSPSVRRWVAEPAGEFAAPFLFQDSAVLRVVHDVRPGVIACAVVRSIWIWVARSLFVLGVRTPCVARYLMMSLQVVYSVRLLYFRRPSGALLFPSPCVPRCGYRSRDGYSGCLVCEIPTRLCSFVLRQLLACIPRSCCRSNDPATLLFGHASVL